MSTFTINLNNIKEEVKVLNNYITNYKDTINTIKKTLANVDSFWNDYNTIPFIKTINDDASSFTNHINAVSNYVKITEKFCDDIKSCMLRYTGKNNVVKIKYNSSNIDLSISDLDNAEIFLKNALDSLEAINFPLTFKYRPFFVLLEISLKKYISTISSSKSVLKSIRHSINKILSSAKHENSKVEFRIIDTRSLNYRWQTYTSSLKTVEDTFQKEHDIAGTNSNQNLQQSNHTEIDTITSVNFDDGIIELLDVDISNVNFNQNVNLQNYANQDVTTIDINYVSDKNNIQNIN